MQRNGGYIGARRGWAKQSSGTTYDYGLNRNQGVYDLYDRYIIKKGETEYYSGGVGSANLTPSVHTFQTTANDSFPYFYNCPLNNNGTNYWRYLFLRRELDAYKGCWARLVFKYQPAGWFRGDFQLANITTGDAIHFTSRTQGPDSTSDPQNQRYAEDEPYTKSWFGSYHYNGADAGWNGPKTNPYYDETGDMGWERNSDAGSTETDYDSVSWEDMNESWGSTQGKWNADINGTGSNGTGINWYWYGGGSNWYYKWYLYTEVSNQYSTSKRYWLRSPPVYLGLYPFFRCRYGVYGNNMGTCNLHLEIINRGENLEY